MVPGTITPRPAAYDADYIVVGSGAGGGTVAARLAESGFRVLLIEAGGDPRKTVGSTPQTPGVGDKFPGICAMAEEYGWDTPLYRADHLQEPGSYRLRRRGITAPLAKEISRRDPSRPRRSG